MAANQIFEQRTTNLSRRKLVDELFRTICLLGASTVVVLLVILIGTIVSSASTALTWETSLPKLINDTGTSAHDWVTNEPAMEIEIVRGTGPVESIAEVIAVDGEGEPRKIGTSQARNDGSFLVSCEPLPDGEYQVHFEIINNAGSQIEKSRSTRVVIDTVPPSGLRIDTSTLGDKILVDEELNQFVIGGSGIEDQARVKVAFSAGEGKSLGPIDARIKNDGRWRIPVTSLQRIDAGATTPSPRGDLVVQATQFDLAGNAESPVELELTYDRESDLAADLRTEFEDDDVDLSVLDQEPVLPTNVYTFLTSHHFDSAPEVSGIFRALVGSMLLCLICAVFTIPIGIGTAIFLEDFRPKNKYLKTIHGFIQLNISNLAGVPSIVYGILGVTAFVYMFSLFPVKTVDSRPEYEFGANYVYQLETAGGQICTFTPDDTRDTFFEISEPTEVVGDEGPFMLQVVDSLEGLSAEERYQAVVRGSVNSKASLIDSEHAWYYISLPFGKSFLSAGLTLGLVVLPIIIIASQEAIRAVPNSLREASMGMGATKWQTVRHVVLPSATPGIMTGTILALSRAIGEAAPILAVMGGVLGMMPKNLMENTSALPILIYKWAKDDTKGFHSLSAAAIVVLLILLLIMNSAAIIIRHRSEHQKD